MLHSSTSLVRDSEVALLRASFSSSIETVALDVSGVHTAPIASEVIEPDSTESNEPIDIETNDHIDPAGNCEIIAENNMLIVFESVIRFTLVTYFKISHMISLSS